MPYRKQWFDAPKDMNLKVYQSCPEGYGEYSIGITLFHFGVSPSGKLAYRCRWCEGWIIGKPSEYEENTIEVLSGRKGWASYCIRCGKEIDFFGECA
jgi:hypothetical protein